MLERRATEAMGTRFELVLAGEDPVWLGAVAEEALEEIERWDATLSRFRRDSLVAHVSRNAHQHSIVLDEDVFELFQTCLRVGDASRGAFDITLAPWMQAWGFHEGDGAHTPPGERPGPESIELDPTGRTIRFRHPGIELDLGAVGKGHALDCAARLLREHGVQRALLHGGTSTVVAIGTPPDEEGWSIGLPGVGAPTVILADRALSVSAPGGRTVERDGVRHGHLLDPRTGAPTAAVENSVVVSGDATTADAWSTALAVDPDLEPAPEMSVALERAHPAGWQVRDLAGVFSFPAPVATTRTAQSSEARIR